MKNCREELSQSADNFDQEDFTLHQFGSQSFALNALSHMLDARYCGSTNMIGMSLVLLRVFSC